MISYPVCEDWVLNCPLPIKPQGEKFVLHSPPPIKLHAPDPVLRVPPTIVAWSLVTLFLHPPPKKVNRAQSLKSFIIFKHPPPKKELCEQ